MDSKTNSLRPELDAFVVECYKDLVGINKHFKSYLFGKYSSGPDILSLDDFVLFYQKLQDYEDSDEIIIDDDNVVTLFGGKTLLLVFNKNITSDYDDSGDMRIWEHMEAMQDMAELANIGLKTLESNIYEDLASKEFKLQRYYPRLVGANVKMGDYRLENEKMGLKVEYAASSNLSLITTLEFDMTN